MQKTFDQNKTPVRDDQLQVPTKEEILTALQQDSARGGLQLEWMLDRCTAREGTQ
ncbi:hypothetical protein MWU60_17200 [Yoonia sp. F2084L]|uniref:hypothetical protein n=1 Tax=Yoonia sp. F2084L TaxID=2926419 RepID=UPI001FF10BCE|nr:hypothetical protein [Yoonia sp. F2084L]MCK0097318.1 hypothetical protein [Yoonia sp. F2084L]